MGSEWQHVSIGELAAPQKGAIAMGPFGSRIRTENFVADGVPVIRGGNLNSERLLDDAFVYISEDKADELKSANAFAEDIVVTHRGTLGQVGIIPQQAKHKRYVVSQSQMKLTMDRTRALPMFIFYFLRSPMGQHQLLAYSSQTGVPAIARPTQALKSIQLLLPPLPEQRAIAHVLGTLDDKIELNRRMNETLEALARALFKSWFVDFDPVRAKAEGRDPGLPPELADLFPDAFEDSELGEIPAGWNVAYLPDAIEVNPSRPLKKGTLAPYLDMAHMPTTGHVPDRWVWREYGSGMRFCNGDTLVARITPCLENGKTAYVDFLEADQIGWGSTEYIVLSPKEPFPGFYVYLLARSGEFRRFAIRNMSGSSGRQRVPASSLEDYLVVIPPSIILECFEQQIRPLISRIHRASSESHALAALRDTLLPKLISGEIRVPEME
jgi:type I restriction enzyme S subunit